LGEQPAASGAGLGERPKIGNEITVGIAAAAIENAFLFTHSFQQRMAALRAVNPNLNLKWFGVFAIRVAGAG